MKTQTKSQIRLVHALFSLLGLAVGLQITAESSAFANKKMRFGAGGSQVRESFLGFSGNPLSAPLPPGCYPQAGPAHLGQQGFNPSFQRVSVAPSPAVSVSSEMSLSQLAFLNRDLIQQSIDEADRTRTLAEMAKEDEERAIQKFMSTLRGPARRSAPTFIVPQPGSHPASLGHGALFPNNIAAEYLLGPQAARHVGR